MLELMGAKVSKQAVVVFYGLDNEVFYEENEDGDRALPKADSDGTYHVRGRVEVASPKQVKNLVHNCGPILEKGRENKTVILSPGVRYFRCSCCEERSTVSTWAEADTGGGCKSNQIKSKSLFSFSSWVYNDA